MSPQLRWHMGTDSVHVLRINEHTSSLSGSFPPVPTPREEGKHNHRVTDGDTESQRNDVEVKSSVRDQPPLGHVALEQESEVCGSWIPPPDPEFLCHANSNIVVGPLIPRLEGPPDGRSWGVLPGLQPTPLGPGPWTGLAGRMGQVGRVPLLPQHSP